MNNSVSPSIFIERFTRMKENQRTEIGIFRCLTLKVPDSFVVKSLVQYKIFFYFLVLNIVKSLVLQHSVNRIVLL